MSIRHGLLALLDGGPKHGYQLRVEFETATGGSWPLNVGQVYTTLNRLERDGLVQGIGTDDAGRVRYQLTEPGRDALRRWLATPVEREARPRDELAIKLALALTVAGADVERIVQTQRAATLRVMQEYTRLKKDLLSAGVGADLSWSLVLDSLIFTAEAEIRWLDHCETRLTRAARTQAATTARDEEHAARQREGTPR